MASGRLLPSQSNKIEPRSDPREGEQVKGNEFVEVRETVPEKAPDSIQEETGCHPAQQIVAINRATDVKVYEQVHTHQTPKPVSQARKAASRAPKHLY